MIYGPVPITPDQRALTGATVRQRSLPVPEEARPVLNLLRLVSLQCRSKARSNLFEACAELAQDGPATEHAHAVALVGGLPFALSKEPVFYRPGLTKMSFDEAWVLCAIDAVQQADHDSLAFLMRSRVVPEHRAHIIFLLRGVADDCAELCART